MKPSKKHSLTALLICTACVCLCGCSQDAEVLYDPTADIAEPDTTAALSAENAEVTATEPIETEPAETESISYLQAQQEEMYVYPRENGFKIGDSGALCFRDPASDSDEPIERNEYNLPLQDGTLELDLSALAASMDDIDYNVTGTFIFCWNGQIYDFTLDGRQSTNGMLQLDMRYWEEITVPFIAEDLPIREGDNTMFFWFFPYCEETGYLTAQNFIGYYDAEEARAGREPVTMTAEAELDPARITVETNKIKALTSSLVDPSDFISSNSTDHRANYTVHETPTFYVNLCNAANAEGASNRSGIAMFFVDGQLQPVWNGANYAAVSATDRDYAKQFAVPTDFQSGEQHRVLMVYAEIQDDKNADGNTYMQSMECRCTVED